MSRSGFPAQGVLEYESPNGQALAVAPGILPDWQGPVGDLRDGALEDMAMVAGILTINRPGFYQLTAKVPVTVAALENGVSMNLIEDPAGVATVIDHDSFIGAAGAGELLLLCKKVIEVTAAQITAGTNQYSVRVIGAAGDAIGNTAGELAARWEIEKRRS